MRLCGFAEKKERRDSRREAALKKDLAGKRPARFAFMHEGRVAMHDQETFYDVMRRHGVTRRSFLKFCTLTAAGLGLGPEFVGKIAHALETKPRTPVIWLHGLECTCCTESFIR